MPLVKHLVIWLRILQDSNNVITKLQLGIITAWLMFTIAAFGYFISDRLVSFDEYGKLKNIENDEISNYLSRYLDHNAVENTQTIVHFSTPNCDCQQFSEEHIEDINTLGRSNGFSIKNIALIKDKVIPSTPSIALIDGAGKVIYFGPYGQGLACSQTTGYAQTMLNNYVKGYSANIVIKEAKGCYCEI